MPTTLIAAAAVGGLGLSVFGGLESKEGAKQAAQAQQGITQAELQQEGLRKQAAELEARRSQLQVLRNQQQAYALSLTTATAQGADQGSGLQGGYGQIAGDSGTNLLAINQNLDIGRQNFGINQRISQLKIQQSQAQSKISEGQAFSSLGSNLVSLSSTMGNLAGNFKGFGAGSATPRSTYNPGFKGSLY